MPLVNLKKKKEEEEAFYFSIAIFVKTVKQTTIRHPTIEMIWFIQFFPTRTAGSTNKKGSSQLKVNQETLIQIWRNKTGKIYQEKWGN